jgi:hypothetical protein
VLPDKPGRVREHPWVRTQVELPADLAKCRTRGGSQRDSAVRVIRSAIGLSGPARTAEDRHATGTLLPHVHEVGGVLSLHHPVFPRELGVVPSPCTSGRGRRGPGRAGQGARLPQRLPRVISGASHSSAHNSSTITCFWHLGADRHRAAIVFVTALASGHRQARPLLRLRRYAAPGHQTTKPATLASLMSQLAYLTRRPGYVSVGRNLGKHSASLLKINFSCRLRSSPSEHDGHRMESH